ncbi:MAG: ADP compounds hydrolase NudE [Pseudomonadota bacterium]
MQLPEILQRERAGGTGFFRIERLHLKFSNGVQRVYERLLAGRREAVIVVALNDEDNILLIREYAAGVHENALTLPKGTVDDGETLEQAAARELAEETGFSARRLEVIKKLTIAPSHMGYTINVVFARDLFELRLEGDEPEPPEVVPWPRQRVGDLLEGEAFHEARAIAAVILCRKQLNLEGL